MSDQLPGEDVNLRDAAVIADVFSRAAEANRSLTSREGIVVALPAQGTLTVSGDLHDNLQNFMRLLQIAKLDQDDEHHLVLQEVIHGSQRFAGCDLSIITLARVACLILDHPGQVHMLLSNHELSQLNGVGILKNGASVTEAYDDGIDMLYANDKDRVREAMNDFIRSLPVAVRSGTGIFISHSLPAPRYLDEFDPARLARDATREDMQKNGHVHRMVWGRGHTPEFLDALAARLDVELFVIGHQPTEMGYDTVGQRMLVLSSDHAQGMALRIELNERYTLDGLVDQLVPLAAYLT